jgi:transposase
MRTLQLHFPDEALSTLDIVLKQTKEARVFRRAQAVREVVKGQRLQTVSDTLHFTYSALRKWVHRFASQGVQGLTDRPRSGRLPTLTCALAYHLERLVALDPLQHGSSHSQWSCQELAMALARETGVHLSRESVRDVLKKRRQLPVVPPGASLLPPLRCRGRHSTWLPLSTKLDGVRSFCSTKMKPSSGGLPYPGRAGGAAKPSAIACRHGL